MAIAAFETLQDKRIFWHTTAIVLAQAVKRLFPEAKLGMGPAIDSGFYYDFDLDHRFTEKDLTEIEAEMKRIVREDLPITRREVTRLEALGEAVSKDPVLDCDFTVVLEPDASTGHAWTADFHGHIRPG